MFAGRIATLRAVDDPQRAALAARPLAVRSAARGGGTACALRSSTIPFIDPPHSRQSTISPTIFA